MKAPVDVVQHGDYIKLRDASGRVHIECPVSPAEWIEMHRVADEINSLNREIERLRRRLRRVQVG